MISLRGADVKVCLSIFWTVIWQMTDWYVFVPDLIIIETRRRIFLIRIKAFFVIRIFSFFLNCRFLSNTVEVRRKLSAFLNVSVLNRVDTNGNIVYNIYDRLNRMIRTLIVSTIHTTAQKICFFHSTAWKPIQILSAIAGSIRICAVDLFTCETGIMTQL